MSDPSSIAPQDYLQVLAGTYLRNVLRGDGACWRCGGHTNTGYQTCFVCGGLSPEVQPDTAAFMTYGADGTTAGTLMYGYKGAAATTDQQAVIKLLSHRGFAHAACAERRVGAAVTHCVVIPSTRGRADTHPLQALVEPFLPWRLHPLVHHGVTPVRQRVQPDLFEMPPLPPGSHVLILEDTWTSGNRPLSAVAAARVAGAEHVSLICLARWLSFDFISTPRHASPPRLHTRLLEQKVYDVSICPFTGADCI